jgi:hypothetical protein
MHCDRSDTGVRAGTQELHDKIHTVKSKVRALLVLPAIVVAGVGLSACGDSKVGSAAVVNGDKISESDLSSYISRNASPIANSDGTSTNPSDLVLTELIQNKIITDLWEQNGGVPSQADLNKVESQALQGQSHSDALTSITNAGLEPKYLDLALNTVEMNVLLTQKYSQAQLTSLLAKTPQNISVSARYGSWDHTNLVLAPLSKSQLPSGVTIDATLPGEANPSAKPSASPSQ